MLRHYAPAAPCPWRLGNNMMMIEQLRRLSLGKAPEALDTAVAIMRQYHPFVLPETPPANDAFRIVVGAIDVIAVSEPHYVCMYAQDVFGSIANAPFGTEVARYVEACKEGRTARGYLH